MLAKISAEGVKANRVFSTLNNLLADIAKLSLCIIGLEACPGKYYWVRKFGKFGHNLMTDNLTKTVAICIATVLYFPTAATALFKR